jgi:hypothetical protein
MIFQCVNLQALEIFNLYFVKQSYNARCSSYDEHKRNDAILIISKEEIPMFAKIIGSYLSFQM